MASMAGPGLQMLGGGLSAYGALQQGQMTSQTLQAQAQMQTQQAAEAEAAGAYNATRETLLANQKIGTSVAAYGANGVSGDSGSVTAVLQSSAANAELDRLNILHGADVKAINYENQASLDNYGAVSAILGSKWKAAGDLTGGLLQGGSNMPGGSGGGEGAASDMGPAGGASDMGDFAGGGEGAGMAAGGGMSMADAAAVA